MAEHSGEMTSSLSLVVCCVRIVVKHIELICTEVLLKVSITSNYIVIKYCNFILIDQFLFFVNVVYKVCVVLFNERITM